MGVCMYLFYATLCGISLIFSSESYAQEHASAASLLCMTLPLEDGIYLPEFTYGVGNVNTPLVLGPLHPCVGIIVHAYGPNFLGVHLHKRNIYSDMSVLVQQELAIKNPATDPMMGIVYTRHTRHVEEQGFGKGGHLRRTQLVCAALCSAFPKLRLTTYYVTENDISDDSDLWLVAKMERGNLSVFRHDPHNAGTFAENGNKEHRYTGELLKKLFLEKAYVCHTNSIWSRFDVSLEKVDAKNLAHIRALPACSYNMCDDLFSTKSVLMYY